MRKSILNIIPLSNYFSIETVGSRRECDVTIKRCPDDKTLPFVGTWQAGSNATPNLFRLVKLKGFEYPEMDENGFVMPEAYTDLDITHLKVEYKGGLYRLYYAGNLENILSAGFFYYYMKDSNGKELKSDIFRCESEVIRAYTPISFNETAKKMYNTIKPHVVSEPVAAGANISITLDHTPVAGTTTIVFVCGSKVDQDRVSISGAEVTFSYEFEIDANDKIEVEYFYE